MPIGQETWVNRDILTLYVWKDEMKLDIKCQNENFWFFPQFWDLNKFAYYWIKMKPNIFEKIPPNSFTNQIYIYIYINTSVLLFIQIFIICFVIYSISILVIYFPLMYVYKYVSMILIYLSSIYLYIICIISHVFSIHLCIAR